MKEEQIYRSAINRFGWIQQLDMTVEECAELIVALQHFVRDKASMETVAGEIADVEIMCGQMRLLFPGVDEAKERKLKRLEGMVNNAEQAGT